MATQALAVLDNNVIAAETGFSARDVQMVTDQLMPGASPDELFYFLKTASARGLDPFRRHIFAVGRRTKDDKGNWVTKYTHQTSIDGFRLIAERTGKYEGQTEPQWCGDDGVWKNVWIAPEPPTAARIGVWKKNGREPLYAVALYRSFVQLTKDGNPTQFWHKMPELMLAKCAEAQALRKAFPEEMGGLYTADEMGNDDAAESARAELQRSSIETTATIIDEPVDLDAAKRDKVRGQLEARANQYDWKPSMLKEFSQHVIGKGYANADYDELVTVGKALTGLDEGERVAIADGAATIAEIMGEQA